jgi:hypothetical protein
MAERLHECGHALNKNGPEVVGPSKIYYREKNWSHILRFNLALECEPKRYIKHFTLLVLMQDEQAVKYL